MLKILMKTLITIILLLIIQVLIIFVNSNINEENSVEASSLN